MISTRLCRSSEKNNKKNRKNKQTQNNKTPLNFCSIFNLQRGQAIRERRVGVNFNGGVELVSRTDEVHTSCEIYSSRWTKRIRAYIDTSSKLPTNVLLVFIHISIFFLRRHKYSHPPHFHAIPKSSVSHITPWQFPVHSLTTKQEILNWRGGLILLPSTLPAPPPSPPPPGPQGLS